MDIKAPPFVLVIPTSNSITTTTGMADFFYLELPVAPPHNPNSSLSSSDRSQTTGTQVDPFAFDLNQFISNFTIPVPTYTPGDEPEDLIARPREALISTSSAALKKEPRKRRVPASNSSNSGRQRAARAPYSSVDQRKQKLANDDYVSEIFEEESQVLCAGCEQRINLDNRGVLYLQNWISHRKRCKGVKDGIVSRRFRLFRSFLISPPSDPLATY